jgi:hypothetical protein
MKEITMISPDEVLEMVSLETGIPIEVIKNPKIRLKHVLSARHKAFKELYARCFLSANKISKIFEMDTGTIRNALNKA